MIYTLCYQHEIRDQTHTWSSLPFAAPDEPPMVSRKGHIQCACSKNKFKSRKSPINTSTPEEDKENASKINQLSNITGSRCNPKARFWILSSHSFVQKYKTFPQNFGPRQRPGPFKYPSKIWHFTPFFSYFQGSRYLEIAWGTPKNKTYSLKIPHMVDFGKMRKTKHQQIQNSWFSQLQTFLDNEVSQFFPWFSYHLQHIEGTHIMFEGRTQPWRTSQALLQSVQRRPTKPHHLGQRSTGCLWVKNGQNPRTPWMDGYSPIYGFNHPFIYVQLKPLNWVTQFHVISKVLTILTHLYIDSKWFSEQFSDSKWLNQ